MWVLERDDFYPPHLDVGNLYFHRRKGLTEVGRHVVCRVCNEATNSRTRNGDAAFIRRHRHCWKYGSTAHWND